MTSQLYNLVCAACGQHLGRVQPHQADHLGSLHAPHCTATIAQYDQAFAAVTNNNTAWLEQTHGR